MRFVRLMKTENVAHLYSYLSDLLQKEIWKHTRFKTPLIKLEIRIITLDY